MAENAKNYATNIQQNVDPQAIQAQVQANLPTPETVQGLVNNLRAQVEDMAPVGASPDLFKNLLLHYSWVAVCLFVGAAFNVFLAKILGIFLGLVLGGGALFLFTMLLAPYLIVDVVPTKVEGSDDDKRNYQLGLAAVSGLAFATLTSGSWVPFMCPPAFLVPLLMGAMANAVGPTLAEQPRGALLGAMVGTPALVHLVYGWITGSLCGLYFIWTLLLAGVAVVDLQVKLSMFKSGKAVEVYHQGVSLAAFMVASCLMTFLASVRE